MGADCAWQPSASIECLGQRARFLASIRQFFTQRAYLEVETPVLGRYGVTDVYLNNIKATFRNQSYCLQTSPEYHMKRLLAAGSGPIFQLARVFRDDELGRWHNPEFTLLEWYQLDIDHQILMDEVDVFLQTMLASRSMVKKTYEQAFLESCEVNPFLATLEELQQVLVHYDLQGVLSPQEEDRDQYLFLLMSQVVEPFLAKESAPVAVYDFPVSQASLAKAQGHVASRFEVYYQGVELANGFHELTQVEVQVQRFALDQELRRQKGLAFVEADPFLLGALAHGIPPCSGVALGVDRLLALAFEQKDLASVMSFDFSRA